MFFEVPGYYLNEKISVNGTFWVYRGQRLQDEKAVLIKVFNQPYPAPKSLAPLWQEFEILRLLDFPGVEKAYGLENHLQWWMIVLEDFGGRPLDQLDIAGCMEPEKFLKLALQLADIVKEIHVRQVIHKHISPSNLSCNLSTGEIRLSNFVYASLVAKEKVPLTSAYQLAGSLAHISPEMTGRLNRSVDYRTDYYSLGATLYELLTGTPPFREESPLELIHAHLAVSPASPASRIEPWKASPTAFQMLSAILLKLLSKNPEDRYQTPGALQADLLHCLSALQNPPPEGAALPDFVPGMVDHLANLNISQTVVGRERETKALLKALLRTAGGPGELVLVSGEAGVGKTTLVNQLIGPVAERMGYFLNAKFDQVPHHNVYHTLTELLEAFCQLVLSEPASSFKEWQGRVQAAVGPLGQLLTDLCPQLEMVIGPQPPLEPVDEEMVRHRFHQVVIRFLGAICRTDHPMVIFLDNLHWINRDSLLLWHSILSTPSLQNLLVVGAYRDNEVGPEHLIHKLVRELETAEGRLTQLNLQNLDWSMIQKLIAAALNSDPAEISELANLVFLRTEGNPYFSNEILKSLHKDQLLSFNLNEQKWRWDTNRIEDYGVASNVVDLFVHEIANLDGDIQKTLQYAACIGRRFDTATLLAILGQDNADMLAYSLWQAMMEGLIYPLDENYRFLAIEDTDEFSEESGELLPSLAELLEEEILFEFQHDRVQQAALAMLDERQLRNASLIIGSMLLEKAEQIGQAAVQENLMIIVNHLNAGRALIEDQEEAIKIAQLNLMASNQARSAAAFDAASTYLSAGIQLLPENCWHDQYTLTVELFIAGAEVALLNGDLAQAEALALTAEEKAHSVLEKARIMKIRMDIYMIQTRLELVFELGLAVIKMLGFDLELSEPPVLIPEEAMQLPAMTEPRALEVSRLDELMISSGYAGSDPRLPQVVLFYIDLFSRFGNPPTASYIYVSYAVILLLSRFEQVEQGCRLGRMALELAEKGGHSKTLYAVRYVYYGFVHHWWRPAKECINPLYESFQPAVESGNLKYSISLQDLAAEISLFVGTKLEQVRSEQAEALRRLVFLNNVEYTQRLRIWSQVALNLTGESLHPQEIYGELFDQDEAQKLIDDGQNFQYMFYLYTAQAFLTFLFREPLRAVKASAAAEPLKDSAQNYLIYPIHLFIYSLALLSQELDPSTLAARLEKVDENLRLMRLWAGFVPENFLHQLELVEAERARCLGNNLEAAKSYERAIQDARRNGYIHESALAAELAAEFYLAQQDYPTAVDYLFTAYYAYLAWGAQAKVEDLGKRYPDWLPPGKYEHRMDRSRIAAVNLSMDEITSSIDLNTILRASLELAQETDLAELLRKLLAILIKNTGAQNGSLVLWLDGRWFLEVQGSSDPERDFALLSIPLEDLANQYGGPLVPLFIIHYVINSEVDLVLADASATPKFSQDPYIQSRQPKSVLCAPLLNQGVLSGVVYLENNLAAGVFTSNRLELVQLISGQAAVSIEKARLYENLEALVEERTRELSNANRKLKEEIEERTRVEEALKESEARLRSIAENAPVFIAELDLQGRILYANRAPAGYQTADLIGASLFDFIPPEYHSEVENLLKNVSSSGEMMHTEIKETLTNEQERWQAAHAAPVFGKGGVEHFVLISTDVTAQKWSEEQLRASEERFRTALENLLDGFAILSTVRDAQGRVVDLRYEYINTAGSRMFPEPEMSILGRSILELAPEFAGSDLIQAGAQLVETGQPLILQNYPLREDYDGPDRDIAVDLQAFKMGRDGIAVTWRDVTERVRQQKALRVAEEFTRATLNSLNEHIAILDENGTILWTNQAWENFSQANGGDPVRTGVGVNYLEVCDRADGPDVEVAKKVAERIRHTLAGKDETFDFEYACHSEEENRWFIGRVTSFSLGDSRRVVVTHDDITQIKLYELALQKSEALYRTVVNTQTELVCRYRPDTTLTFVNAAYSRFAGKSAGDLVGQSLLLSIPESHHKKIRNIIRWMVENPEVHEFEQQMASPGGEERWQRWVHSPILENGKVIEFQGVGIDITERRKMEQLLQENEARLRTALDSAQLAPFDYNLLTGELAWDERTRSLWGIQPGENPNFEETLSRVQPDDRPMAEGALAQALDPGGSGELEIEFRLVWPDGSVHWISASGRASFAGEGEGRQAARLVGILRDITARKRAEEALRESEQKFRMLFENSPDAVFLSIPPGKILAANPAFSAILGWSEEEIPKLGRSDIFDIDDPRLAAGLEERERSRRVQGWELTAVRKNGERFPAEVDSVLLSEEPNRALVIMRDITERKQAEEALRYNEALLRKVLEILPVGVWIMDKAARINSGNPEAQRIWGGVKYVEREEYGEYKAWWAKTGERIKPEEWAGGLAVVEGQVTLDEELEIEAFDGERRTILNSAIPLVTEEDGLIGAIVVNQDITKLKRDEAELQKAHDQLATLLNISQSIVSTLNLDLLLNLIIEELGKVLPYDGAAILIQEGNFLEFRVVRGPEVLHGLSKFKIPVNEPSLIKPLIEEREAFYLQDLLAEKDLLIKIQDTIKLRYDEIAFLRSWLGIPLIAKDVLIGIMVLAHTQPDHYSEPDRILSRAYANQVAIAIHNAQLYEHVHEIAAVEERNRLARELHDSVAQALYSISLFTDATRMALETNKLEVVKAHLGELVGLSREAMSDMRLLIYEMRPPVLEKDGLAAALQSRLDSVESRAGFQTGFQVEGEFHLSQEEETELYRIAQEALNNVLKHARADRVEVQLIGKAGKFMLVIEDNGVGFDLDTAEQAGGQGLRNIQERAEGIGAACRIESAPGEGAKITIEMNQ